MNLDKIQTQYRLLLKEMPAVHEQIYQQMLYLAGLPNEFEKIRTNVERLGRLKSLLPARKNEEENE